MPFNSNVGRTQRRSTVVKPASTEITGRADSFFEIFFFQGNAFRDLR